MLFLMSETPVFLYKIGKTEEADKTLGKIYKSEFLEAKKAEIAKEVQSVMI